MPPRTFLADLLQENTVPVTNQRIRTIYARARLFKFKGTVEQVQWHPFGLWVIGIMGTYVGYIHESRVQFPHHLPFFWLKIVPDLLRLDAI